ncbi:unnamed protein product [Polarella glacialis]|uniref:Uncharacterized protein n=1 Tax=Polarella glacialis TaxID=89957 RepID=A0A813GRY1_POLGL|nr:unnamed protein product [Polarella glacialis]CAE8708182.1 unnamed protein product [Polarella glacialis]
MARRARTTALSLLVAAAAACLIAQLLAPAFVQPKVPRNPETAVAPAVVGALVSLAGSMPAHAWKGPLAGSEVCVTRYLKWVIYPLCDPVFLVSPIYNFPILLAFFTALITLIQILIPATQPDEDLR